MKIIVLGGHGFVGKHVTEILKTSDHEVFPLSRRDSLDLRDYALTTSYLEKIEPAAIVNCAAHVGSLHYISQYPADVIDDNIQIILNLYRAVKEVCPETKIVNPISNCSYPGDKNIQAESEWWDGPVHKSVWSFGNSRRAWVAVSQCYEMQHGIKTINFIAPNAYGPGDYLDPNRTHALNGMIIRMLETKQKNSPEFEIWGTGSPVREWLYVKDLARILADAVNMEKAQSSPLNIGQNKGYSIKETAEMIKELIDFKGRMVFNTNYQDGASIKKLDDKLFRSKYPNFVFTDMRMGIRETINYYKKELNI